MADEFTLIERYFSATGSGSELTRLGMGDDAAVVEVPSGQQLVLSMDTLIGGRHFSFDTAPADIAYKALAVNLSDLAAMGATPAWFLLSLSLEQDDEGWLAQFASGLKQSASLFELQLIGGDTCRGPLAVTIQVGGLLPNDSYVTRAGAAPGDIVLVSGELGNAALGLAQAAGKVELAPALRSKCELALKRPQPRLELRRFLRDYASAAIDISDGLVGDLRHILEASGCGARISRAALPVNDWIQQNETFDYALGGGDDYEICCCVAPRHGDEIESWNRSHADCRLTPIGEITAGGYLMRVGDDLVELDDYHGFRHFD